MEKQPKEGGYIASLVITFLMLVGIVAGITVINQPNLSMFSFGSSDDTEIVVYAAGAPFENIYPEMEIKVGDQTVATFSGIKGNVANEEYLPFSYKLNESVSGQSIYIVFVNGSSDTYGRDRTLVIDKIEVEGVVYETEDATVYSEGVWNGTDCNGGYRQSETLSCSGYFRFDIP